MVDLSAYAGKRIRIQFSLTNSSYAGVSAGWYIDDVSVAVAQPNNVPPYADDFESGLGDWWAHNGTWQVGSPTSGPGSCYSGTQCAATVLDGDYPNTNSSLISPPIDLPTIAAGAQIQLRFWHWFSIATGSLGNDAGIVYVQEETAPGVWSAVTQLTTYTGTSGGVWTRPLVDLSAYAGKRIRIQFSLANSSYAGVSAGWYIDDVSIQIF